MKGAPKSRTVGNSYLGITSGSLVVQNLSVLSRKIGPVNIPKNVVSPLDCFLLPGRYPTTEHTAWTVRVHRTLVAGLKQSLKFGSRAISSESKA